VFPAPDNYFTKNPISILSRWKIFDNLRRSLVPIALCLLLLLGWTLRRLPGSLLLSVIGIILIPSLINCLMGFFNKPAEALMIQHLTSAARATGRCLTQSVFTLLCLPYEAFTSGSAILQTLWRMLFSRRGLLEWNPPGETDRTSRTTLAGSYRSMWIAPVIAMAVAGYLVYARSEALPVALPILILWFVSPFIAWWISIP
jgi:cyclic beta-1,2-glucan synthetase